MLPRASSDKYHLHRTRARILYCFSQTLLARTYAILVYSSFIFYYYHCYYYLYCYYSIRMPFSRVVSRIPIRRKKIACSSFFSLSRKVKTIYLFYCLTRRTIKTRRENDICSLFEYWISCRALVFFKRRRKCALIPRVARVCLMT